MKRHRWLSLQIQRREGSDAYCRKASISEAGCPYPYVSFNFWFPQDEEYLFPPLQICFIPGEGCDRNLGDGSACAASAWYTVYDPCSNVYNELIIDSEVSAKQIWVVSTDLVHD